MSSNNLSLSFVLKMVNQAAAPMKGAVSDLVKMGGAAKATQSPLKGAADAVSKVNSAAKASAPAFRSAGSAATKYGDDLDRLQRRANAAARVIGRNLGRSIGTGAVSAVKMGVAAYGAYAASVYSAIGVGTLWIKHKAQELVALNRAASALGITADRYQRLQYAYKSVDLTGADLDQTLTSVAKNATLAAAGGKEQARAFKALGIEVTTAGNKVKRSDALLAEVADRFAKMPDGSKKATLSTMLFGDSATRLIPLLNQGSAGLKRLGDQAAATGNVLDESAIKNSERLMKTWKGLTGTVFGLNNSIFSGLLPSGIKLLEWLNGLLQANREDILKGIQSGVDWLIKNTPALLDGLGKFWKLLGDIGAIVGPVVSGLGGLTSIIDGLAVLMIGKAAVAMITTTASVLGLQGSVWALNSAVWAFPGTWIIAAVAGVAAAAYLLFRNWKPIDKFFSGLWDGVKKVFSGFVSWVSDNFMKFPLPLKLLAAPIMIVKYWKPISAFFVGLWGKVKSIWTGLPVWAQALISLPLTIVTHWKTILPVFQGLWTGITSIWDGAVKWFGGVFDAIGNVIKGALDVLWRMLPDWFKGFLKFGADALQFVVGGNNLMPSAPVSAPRPSGPSATPSLTQLRSSAAQPVNGQLEITLKQDGSARVTKMNTSGPLDMSVNTSAARRFGLDRGVQGAGY